MSFKEPLKIVGADRGDEDAVIVEYSDQTSAVYSLEQLRGLEPTVEVGDKDEVVGSAD